MLLIALIALQIVTLALLLGLCLRRQAAAEPRLAELPETIAQHHATVLQHHAAVQQHHAVVQQHHAIVQQHHAIVQQHHARLDERFRSVDDGMRGGFGDLRNELTSHRNDSGTHALATREAQERSASGLRTEVLAAVDTLGKTLHSGLEGFRTDNSASAQTLRNDVQGQLDALTQRLNSFVAADSQRQIEARDALHNRLTELGSQQAEHQERLRGSIEERLAKLNADNSAKLDEMRRTVDEKLSETLQTRLTESFGQVTDQLTKVHSGLGEMSKLSEGVDDLSRIFTNVKSRGGFAEVQLGMLLEQMLAPGQFVKNAHVKPNSQEVVEFAVRFPGPAGETLLPIDAKFPREDWERLENAYDHGTADEIAAAGKAFERAIRTEGDRICSKYIQPPITTPHALMFLPTEGLYAEVMRRDGLQAEVQSKCRVTIAGPSTLSAILTSFQMGFHMLAIQQKGDEVWKVLGATRNQFEKFGDLMTKMEKNVGTVQNTMHDLGIRTRAINRTLRDVGRLDASDAAQVLQMDDPVLRLVAADSAEDVE
jgi:DNA recombination protein RmuC